MDRTPGAGKPVDPATRLSELLAQSLEELTRPFDAARPGAAAAQPGARRDEPEAAERPVATHEAGAASHEPPAEPAPEPVDADRALAELEAELFAAAKQLDSEAGAKAAPPATPAADRPPAEPDAPSEPTVTAPVPAPDKAPGESTEVAVPAAAPLAPDQPVPDPDAARVIAKVRKLMLVSMAVTLIAVGSVFGLIGYRVYKGEGSVEKKADKLPESSPIPNDVTLSLPRNARIVQSAVTNDRLIMTLEIDGRIEVRTFDVRTLQPAGRLDFSTSP